MTRNLFGPLPSDEPKRLVLTVQKFCYTQTYDRDFQIDTREQWLRSAVHDGYERRLIHYVYGQANTAEYSHPADWWQAFRARWFPKRWLRRWPVRLKTVSFDAKALVPELKVMADKHIVCYFGELRE